MLLKHPRQYACSEFQRHYVQLWVLFRKWGMKGVCLRKRWGKFYRRCIGKFSFLAFIEWIPTFYMFINDEVSEIIHLKKNTVNCAMIYPFCVISKSGWYRIKLKNAFPNEMNFLQKRVFLQYKLKLFLVLLTCKMSEIYYKAIFTTLS